jgi:hypothetical protein
MRYTANKERTSSDQSSPWLPVKSYGRYVFYGEASLLKTEPYRLFREGTGMLYSRKPFFLCSRIRNAVLN